MTTVECKVGYRVDLIADDDCYDENSSPGYGELSEDGEIEEQTSILS